MKNRTVVFLLGTFALGTALAASAIAQNSELPAPSPVEKELAARASHVDEVTLNKNMLGFASQVMSGKNKDQNLQKLIDGLDGIYVRDYEFDKDGQVTAEQVEKLRKYFETSEWMPLVRDHDQKTGETSDVMVKMVNGKKAGMFILDVEPKEVSIVLILGSFQMEDLGKLGGIIGASVGKNLPTVSR
jgi:hypothetical protein